MDTPRFIYFDLGKVLVDFSIERMLCQMAAVSGVGAEKVGEILFGNGDLQKRYEKGEISSRAFYELYCTGTGTRPDYAALCRAGTEIFSLIVPMVPIVAQLRQAGCRLGILSNTCEYHWRYCLEQYRIIAEGFQVYAVSYRIGAVKPDAAIFKTAAELAGCPPEEIFYVDDIPKHVEGAKAVGLDAVVFESPAQVAAELRRRGVKFNY
jgi:FMN phosphatase YigB (HAD superfamily)